MSDSIEVGRRLLMSTKLDRPIVDLNEYYFNDFRVCPSVRVQCLHTSYLTSFLTWASTERTREAITLPSETNLNGNTLLDIRYKLNIFLKKILKNYIIETFIWLIVLLNKKKRKRASLRWYFIWFLSNRMNFFVANVK